MCDWCLYRHQSHITITILWKILYYAKSHQYWWLYGSTKFFIVWWSWCVTGAYIGTSHTSRSPYYAQFCTMPRVTSTGDSWHSTKFFIVWWSWCVTGAYIGTSHTYTITILWKILYYAKSHQYWWLYIVQNFSSYEYGDCTMIGTSHTSRSPYYEKFCTAKSPYCDSK